MSRIERRVAVTGAGAISPLGHDWASVHLRLAALMHDAHEAYVGDMASPTKRAVGEAWYTLEHRIERTLRSAWGLHTATYEHQHAIKQADLIALATERAQLLPPSPSLWQCLVHVQPITWVDLMSPERCAMTWADWRNRFADAVDTLDFERNETTFTPTTIQGHRHAI